MERGRAEGKHRHDRRAQVGEPEQKKQENETFFGAKAYVTTYN